MAKDKATPTKAPNLVSRDEWLAARKDLLAQEKAYTRAGDALAASRRRLPMMRMDPATVVGPEGPVSLQEVFDGRRMLIAYHFMWKDAAPHQNQCAGCTHSQVAITPALLAYLAERDVTYAVFSSGPIDEILAYRDFMGWTAPWYSTAESGDALATREGGDLRCYLRDRSEVFLTYESELRGVEAMLPTLQLLDITPYGRQENWEDSPDGYPQTPTGAWWQREGRPVAQWTRTRSPAD